MRTSPLRNDSAGFALAFLVSAGTIATPAEQLPAGPSLDTPEAILEALDDPQVNTIRIAVLLGALGDMDSPRSQQALVTLLSNTRAEVAATSARVIARHKIACGVPALLRMLSDNRVYAVTRSSHLPPQDITVAEAADAALADITGASARSRGRERIRVFERWWERHRATVQCNASAA